jgi:hypothetical protein
MKAIAERICEGNLVQHAYSANIETDRTTLDEPRACAKRAPHLPLPHCSAVALRPIDVPIDIGTISGQCS